MSRKILFVDDEPAVLEGYKRLLGRDLSIDTAVGGVLGLEAIAKSGPYAVVISDMRMPQMDGAQFLAKVREIAPSTVRLALTGYVDIETAMFAVNVGNIFRFLTKPCSKEDLSRAIEAALEQYRLINAEKDLLEQTLRGAVNVLSEVLSFSNPAAYVRAMRLRRFAQQVAAKLELKSAWQYEIAAMLSQLGCVTLPAEVISAAYAGEPLTPEDQKKFDAHPTVAWQMLSRIPRMEAIAQMIAQQNNPLPHVEARSIEEKEEIELGIQILCTGLAFDSWLGRGLSAAEAAKRVRASMKSVNTFILLSLDDLVSSVAMRLRECAVTELATGMILEEDLRNSNGLLIVAKGLELTLQWIERLKGFSQRGVIGKRVRVSIPQIDAD
ncbi:MAG: HD domain-containing phosphohydrolase [Terracidiphilus sp.]|jgi:CheY-like chemotaxis protein